MSHLHEKIDFTTTAYIVHEGRVLLRKHEKYGDWFGVGGHIELGEDPNQAIIREIKEEVGLDAEIFGQAQVFDDGDSDIELIPPRFLNRHHTSETHEHVDVIYFATVRHDGIIETEGREKSLGLHWFTPEDLADPSYGVRPRVQYHARKAIEEVGAVSGSGIMHRDASRNNS